MSRPKKPTFAAPKPIPLRLDQALVERIEALAEKIGEPKSTVMRMCMRIGLDQLEKVYTQQPERISYPLPEQSAPVMNEERPKVKKPKNPRYEM